MQSDLIILDKINMGGTQSTENGKETDETENSSYYYDDAHGYEDYDPEDDSEEEEFED